MQHGGLKNMYRRTNKCKYGRTITEKDCIICTMYGWKVRTHRKENKKG